MNRLNFKDGEDDDVVIGESNILHHLSIVEVKLNEMISFYQAQVMPTAAGARKTESDCVSFGPDAPMTSDRNMYINPPRFTDYSSDENSGEDGCGLNLRPLTYEELKAKTISRITFQNQRRRSKMNPRRGSVCSMTRRNSILEKRI